MAYENIDPLHDRKYHDEYFGYNFGITGVPRN